MWDVGFHHQIVYTNIEHTSIINKIMQGKPQKWTEQKRNWLYLNYKKPVSIKSLAVKTTCFTQFLRYLKERSLTAIIDGFMATYISKLRWAWQASCLSHTLLILKIDTTFKIFKWCWNDFLIISTSFKFSKIRGECSVHFCSCPCIMGGIM